MFKHTIRFGPTDEDIENYPDEEYACHYCSSKCKTYIMYDRFSNKYTEHIGRITFCSSVCLNETIHQYLRQSFYEGYLAYKSQTFKRTENDNPDYRCRECNRRCSNIFSLTQINSNNEEETLAFCDDYCHNKFSTNYFNYSFEIGYVN